MGDHGLIHLVRTHKVYVFCTPPPPPTPHNPHPLPGVRICICLRTKWMTIVIYFVQWNKHILFIRSLTQTSACLFLKILQLSTSCVSSKLSSNFLIFFPLLPWIRFSIVFAEKKLIVSSYLRIVASF